MRNRRKFSRRNFKSRLRNRCRHIAQQKHALERENQALLAELEQAYQFVLLGQETEVLQEEMRNKIYLLEESNAKLEESNAKVAKLNRELNRAYRDLEEYTHNIMRTLGDLVEGRDAGTSGHCKRLANYSLAIAKELGLTKSQCEALDAGGYLHDIGKVAVPDRILLKPSKLTAEEYEIMKKHVDFGWQLMCNMPSMGETARIVRHHHEHYDGSGYPDGLKGGQIPITARVLALADVFDALIARRPYKDPFPLDEALAIIRKDTETHFDPVVVDAFFRALANGGLTPIVEEE